MKRTLPLLACLAISVLATAQDLAQKVSFTSVAKRAKPMLEELSKVAGVPLLTTGVTENEVLVIHVTDVTVTDLMKKIAEAVNGAWEKDSAGYRLVRPAAKVQEERKNSLDKRTTEIASAIAARVKQLEGEPFNEATAKAISDKYDSLQKGDSSGVFDLNTHTQVQALDQRTSGGRLMTRMLSLIDARKLAELHVGERFVFSSKPTRMQFALQGDLTSALKAFATEHNLWIEYLARNDPDGFDGGDVYMGSLLYRKPIVPGTEPKAIVVCQRREFSGDGISVELKLYDTKGGLLMQSNSTLVEPDYSAMMMPPALPAEGTDEIELSPMSLKMATHFRTMVAENGQLQDRPGAQGDLKEALLQPELHDPLSFVTSDVLVGLAKAKKQNLIANLPDSAIFTLGLSPLTQKLTIGAVETALRKAPDLKTADVEGWLIVTPSDPVESRRNRLDRPALGKLARSTAANGHLTLDDLGAFALTTESDDAGGLLFISIGLLSPSALEGAYLDFKLLRLYASLPPATRTKLANGGKLNFGTMPAATKAAVHAILFGEEMNAIPDEILFTDGRQPDITEAMHGILREPTELMPNGLPAQGELTLTVNNPEVIAAYGQYGQQINELSQLAWEMFMRESPGRYPWMSDSEPPSQFRLAKRKQVTFHFKLPQGIAMEKQLNEDVVEHEKPRLRLDQLPQDFQNKLKKQIDELRKSQRNMPTELPGNQKPPPPAP